MPALRDLAAVVRSKNAGPFLVTIDVFFDDDATFDRVRRSGVLEAASVGATYGIDPAQVSGPYWDTAARGAKVSFPKTPNGNDPACTDMFGAHQHVPVAALEVP